MLDKAAVRPHGHMDTPSTRHGLNSQHQLATGSRGRPSAQASRSQRALGSFRKATQPSLTLPYRAVLEGRERHKTQSISSGRPRTRRGANKTLLHGVIQIRLLFLLSPLVVLFFVGDAERVHQR